MEGLKRTIRVGCFFGAVTFWLSACTSISPHPAPVPLSTSQRSNDVRALLRSMYEQQPILVSDPRAEDKVSPRERWLSALREGKLELKPEKLIQDCDLVTEVGAFTLTVDVSGERQIENGLYLVVWKLSSEGWRLHRHQVTQGEFNLVEPESAS